MPTSVPVVIDSDPGVDDALALALALASPDLSVRAVTTVAGNVDLATGTANADYLLRILAPGRGIRLAQGCAKPLARDLVTAEEVHGSDGLAGITGHERWRRPATEPTDIPVDAVGVIIEEVGASPEPVTVIALGPLTNVAAALQRDPAAMQRAAAIVVMGGSLHAGGNVTPHAEFNFYVDPEAADVVLASGLPVIVTPLDVTHQLAVSDETVESRLLSDSEPRSAFLGELIRRARAEQFTGRGGKLLLHDPAAVGTLLWPELFTIEAHPLTVDCRDGDLRGAMRSAADDAGVGRTAAQVAVDVAADSVVGRIVERLVLSPLL
ncbi:MAG: nucleoside hydrolase [Chloroflexi bacterium]|nr:nucleoside hydrolase [Chloroflexota bacterium]